MASRAARKPKSFSEKIQLVATSIPALCLLPAVAHGAIITVTGSPVSMTLTGPDGDIVAWDVDGNGSVDFNLHRSAYTYSASSYFREVHIESFAPLNGRGLVAPGTCTCMPLALSRSFRVGQTRPGYNWGYSSTYRIAMSTYSGVATVGVDFYYGGFNPGKNLFGFRFLSGSDTLYGFGEIDLDLTNGVVTITQWAYNTVPDGEIHVTGFESVPAPSTPALTLLGLGAAGLVAWRTRRKDRAAKAAAAA
jgi:hypothetical protein